MNSRCPDDLALYSSDMNAMQDAATSEFSLGVLIIGSMYWDTSSKRVEWRSERLLDVHNPHKVKVPIRYGRRSRGRGNTYTMVFSPDLDEGKFGQALAIRCRSQDIVEEAKWLWAAERKQDGDCGVSAPWGCVGLLLNNKSASRLSEQCKRWHEFVSACGERSSSYRELAKHKAGVKEDGSLTIPWPKLANGNGSPLEFDALLAVATAPSNQDPSEIAKSWKEADKKYMCYFYNNRECGIQTSQDDEIAPLLAAD